MRNQSKKINKQKGYTIIETMIAISIFLIVVTIGMGALLNANLVHSKSQDMRSITDSLSFIMDDISKNMRTGYDYHCTSDPSDPDFNTPQSCPSGNGVIAFKHQNIDTSTVEQWVYKIEGTTDFNISKSVDGGTNWVQLNPEELKLTAASRFFVTGALPPPTEPEQPFVTIKLSGNITIPGKNVVTPFSLETSVSQRLLDR